MTISDMTLNITWYLCCTDMYCQHIVHFHNILQLVDRVSTVDN